MKPDVIAASRPHFIAGMHRAGIPALFSVTADTQIKDGQNPSMQPANKKSRLN